ncbi:ZFY16 protein, partial [Smithornis capensis]|nr:ZFY16 protein [Smithornis capensis]
ERNAESMPKRHHWHKSLAALPGNYVSPGFSCQTGAEVELEKKITEEHAGDEELHSNEIPSNVSSSCISTDDVQTSLSCLPVSLCGSLVVTDEKVNSLPQNAVMEVISDTVTVCAETAKTDPSGIESCESQNPDWHEQKEYVAEINGSIAKKSRDGEWYDTKNVIDGGHSQPIEAFASAFLDLEVEPHGIGVDNFYNENLSPDMADFTVEENVIKSDILISDAELDDFLYGQNLQSKVLKSSDNDSNLMGTDADEGILTNVNNRDFMEVTEELTEAKMEEKTSINRNVKASFSANRSEPAAEDNISHSQDVTESGTEALVSDVCTEGARPKQLLGLSHGAADQKQLNGTNVLDKENQESGPVTPEVPLSGTSVSVGKNSDPGESSSEAGGNQTSENTESLKTPATLSWKQPLWVPDSEAPNCMNCQVKFTFTKRRHHCRACGKVFCGSCCKRKCKLQYMEKEARVCTGCYDDINKGKRRFFS